MSVRAVAGISSATVKVLVFVSIMSTLLSALPELSSQPFRGVSELGVMARLRWGCRGEASRLRVGVLSLRGGGFYSFVAIGSRDREVEVSVVPPSSVLSLEGKGFSVLCCRF